MKTKILLVALLMVISVWFAFGAMRLHDDYNHLQKDHNDIMNRITCDNYKDWIDYNQGDWIDYDKDIRAKAQQVKESCK